MVRYVAFSTQLDKPSMPGQHPGTPLYHPHDSLSRSLIQYLTRYIEHKEQSRLQRQDPPRRPQNPSGTRFEIRANVILLNLRIFTQ